MSSLQRIQSAQSLAIIGASADPRALGGFVLGNLETFGYAGAIHLVSRSSAQINGRPCVDQINKLPLGIDLAVLAIPESGVVEAIEQLGERQCHAAVLFASGYAETGADGLARQQTLQKVAQLAGVTIIGPNCMGFTNFAANLPITFEPLSKTYVEAWQRYGASGIAVLAQSGAMAAILRDALLGRGLLPQFVFSTGNEAQLQLEALLAECLQDQSLKVICVYAEQIRSPQLFLQLAKKAHQQGKFITLLMPGKSIRAAAAAASHTGALAGDHALASARLRAHAVALVDSLDELIDTTAILARYPDPPKGGIAFMTGSGAMKNIALDMADAISLDMPELQATTLDRLREQLPSFAVAENPLDYTTIGMRQPGLIGEIANTLLADANIATLVLSIPAGPVVAQRDKAEHILPALATAKKPTVLVINGDDGPIEEFFVDAIVQSKVPFFRSTDRALRALAQVATVVRARAELLQRAIINTTRLTNSLQEIALPTPIESLQNGIYPEYLGKKWLAQMGVCVAQGQLAQSVQEALEIADRIEYPVVIKAQASALPHKSEAGGVIVNIKDSQALETAWETLHQNIAHYAHAQGMNLQLDGVLVEVMGAPGLELILGAKRDVNWGPVVMVGLGGIWIEALHDVQLLDPELTELEIVARLHQLKAAAVLRGIRGKATVDFHAIARVASALAQQMLANPSLLEVDINPLIAYPIDSAAYKKYPVIALDALISINTSVDQSSTSCGETV